MKQYIGFFKAWGTTRKAGKMTEAELKTLQRERLKVIVHHAKNNSPYYSEKYSDIKEDAPLQAFPPVNKRELMDRFEDWVTDREIKMDNLQSFIKNSGNIGRDYLGKYLVSTTSGSTGVPAVFLYDKSNLNVLDALAISRAVAYKGIMGKLVKGGGRSAAIYATGGHYLGVASVKHKQYKNPMKARQFVVLSVLSPLQELVGELNKFQPALLGGYPTALELLIPEQVAGRLNIHPVLINTGGEYLSKNLAQELGKVFGCPVQSGYSCTEGGMIAFQCREGHQHINADWVIIEPVDKDGNPVPAGVLSDKLYLTNLANFAQPVIRYEVTDRVRMLEDPCPCGSNLPTIEVEGRTDDILRFSTKKGEVSVVPLSLYVIMKETPGIVRFQLIQKSGNTVELRLETSGDRAFVENEVIDRLDSFLSEKGIDAVITISAELPKPAASGKFRHVLKDFQEA